MAAPDASADQDLPSVNRCCDRQQSVFVPILACVRVQHRDLLRHGRWVQGVPFQQTMPARESVRYRGNQRYLHRACFAWRQSKLANFQKQSQGCRDRPHKDLRCRGHFPRKDRNCFDNAASWGDVLFFERVVAEIFSTTFTHVRYP